MLFGKPLGKHGVSASATRILGIDLDSPAFVVGSYIALLLFSVLVHRGAWNGDWREDDARQLLSVIDTPFWRLLFKHDAWMTFNFNAFTPILAGQYLLDYFLFGLNPRGFYLHQVTELAIASICTYHLLCQRVPRHLSMLATIGILVAMPTFSVINFLSNRHYLSGLILSIGSVYFYRRALNDERPMSLLISTGLFFLAMLAKELYAVTLLYFILTSWRTALFSRVLALFSVAFSIFALWRGQMLGGFIGGYGTDHPLLERIAALGQVHRAIFGSDLVAAIFTITIVILVFRHRLFGLRHLVGLAAVLIAVYFPLLFATYAFQSGKYYFVLRLSFLPAWLCGVGLAYIAMRLREVGARKTAILVLLAFIAITGFAASRTMAGFRETLHEYDIQGNFIQNAGPTSALFPTSLVGGEESSFQQQISLANGRNPSGIIKFRDDVYPGFSSYWEYDRHCHCMVQLQYSQVLEKASHLEPLSALFKPRDSAPISILVTWQARQGMTRLVFEPAGKSYCLLSVPGMYSMASCPKVTKSLERLIPKDKIALLHAQFGYARQDGLVIITPFMGVPSDGTLQWSRGVFLPSSVQPERISGKCQIDVPTNKGVLSRTSPLELRGWILGPSNTRNDTIPLAILSGSDGKNFIANLHREPRPDIVNPDGIAIGGHVLDADLHRVEPGNYRLLLGIEDSICDTGVNMAIN